MPFTQASLATEILTNLPTNGVGQILAAPLRRTLNDMVTTTFQQSNAINAAINGMAPGNTAAQNAAALTACCTQGARQVYIPTGIYNIGLVNYNGCCHLFGDGPGKTVLVAGAGIANTGVISLFGSHPCLVEDLEVQVDTTAYPTTWGILVGNVAADYPTIVRNCAAQGQYGIVCSIASLAKVDACTVSSYLVHGIWTSGCTNSFMTNNVVYGGSLGSTHGIFGYGPSVGTTCTMIGNVSSGAKAFNYCMQDVSYLTIVGNTGYNSIHEAINISTNSIPVLGGLINNNTISFDSTTVDFGMSYNANPGFPVSNCMISNNVIIKPGSCGIALVGPVNYSIVTGNVVVSPCSTQGPGAAIVTYNSAQNNYNLIQGNNCVDLLGNMTYWVYEADFGGGTPNHNRFQYNSGTNPSIGQYFVVGANTTTIDYTKITIGPSTTLFTFDNSGNMVTGGNFTIGGKQVLVANQLAANDSVATALSSVGPTGAHTTVQEWMTVEGTGGAVRYIPMF